MMGCLMEELLNEHINTFVCHEKQLLILSSAGKPIYSYGEKEVDVASRNFLLYLEKKLPVSFRP